MDGLAHLLLPQHAPRRLSPRFVALCRGLGLVEYWLASGLWPDCAADPTMPYDLIATARRPSPET